LSPRVATSVDQVDPKLTVKVINKLQIVLAEYLLDFVETFAVGLSFGHLEFG